MICYADKTFCAGDGCADFQGCPRALTQDIRERAKAKGLPIAQWQNPKEQRCYREPTVNRIPKKAKDEEMLLADGFDEALIGTARRISGAVVAVYDTEKCIEILCREMSQKDAEEYFYFNVEGAWMGEGTPLFIDMDDLHNDL